MSKMRISIRTKLIAALLLVLIPSNIALGSVIVTMTRNNLKANSQRTLEIMAENICFQVEDFCEREFSFLEGIASIAYLRSSEYSLEEKTVQLMNLREVDPRKYENIAYYDKDGMSYVAQGVKIDFSGYEYFQVAMQGKRYVQQPVFDENITKSTLMFFSVPVYGQNNEVIGVVASIIKGNPFNPIIRQLDVGDGMNPFIVNLENGQYVAMVNEVGVGQEDSEKNLDADLKMVKVFKRIFSGETGTDDFVNPAMKMRLICSFRPIYPNAPFECSMPWSVVCIAPYNTYFGTISKIVRTTVVIDLAFLVFGILGGLVVVHNVIQPLRLVKRSVEEIASGNADLTKRIENPSNDEIGDVVIGFNKFTEKLQDIMLDLKGSKNTLDMAGDDMGASAEDTTASITEILANIESVHSQITNQSHSVNQTAGAVNEIASNIESLERMIENQSSGIVQASAAVEEMMSNITSVNSSVDKMAHEFDLLSEAAGNGAVLQSEATERIEKIREQSETLQDANVAIAAIAEQTNLLAMNAAIEAAHAGEAGKGFSVVADEIRKLSETSGQQSRTIGEHLTSIRESISQMVDTSQQSSNAFQQVADKITETDELVRQIKAAMAEQTSGSQQIGEALQAMNDSTAEVRNASQEMAVGNKSILEEVQILQNATLEMQNSMKEMSVGATKINETGAALADITSKMNSAIVDIGNQVDQFKV